MLHRSILFCGHLPLSSELQSLARRGLRTSERVGFRPSRRCTDTILRRRLSHREQKVVSVEHGWCAGRSSLSVIQ